MGWIIAVDSVSVMIIILRVSPSTVGLAFDHCGLSCAQLGWQLSTLLPGTGDTSLQSLMIQELCNIDRR